MHIALLCATRRGYLFLKKLTALLPHSQLTVFSFREEPWEPPFLNDIRELTRTSRGQFFETKKVDPNFWQSTPVDLMFVVSWRYMIPPSVYHRPQLGAFVFHDSLLPQYRGFSPTVWAMVNGEDHTGVTLFEIAEEVDAGDIVDQQRVPIAPEETIADVMERVTQAYLDLLARNIDQLLAGSAPRYPQDHARATYTCKRLPEDNQINWAGSTTSSYNLIRAASAPYPGAYTYLAGQKLIIWSAKRVIQPRLYVGSVAGRVVEVRPGLGSVVLTGDGALMVTQAQLKGSDPVCAADVLKSVSQTLGR